jgi:hypothetical protein
MKTALVISALVGLSLAALAAADLNGEKPADASNPFAGKVLMIYLSADPEVPSHTLEDVKVEKIWGHDFLVGVGADTKRDEDWTVGMKFKIAVEHILGFTEFTPEEFQKFCEEAEDSPKETRLLPL